MTAPTPPTTARRRRGAGPGALPEPLLGPLLGPLLAAVLAVVVGRLAPLLGPLLVALVLGTVVANTRLRGHPGLRDHHAATGVLLRLGVVLVGLRLPLDEVLAIGLPGIVVVLATVALTFTLTRRLGRVLGLDAPLVALVAAGFSICGAAAVAAVSDAVRAGRRDVALAVALVTVHGSVLIAALPWLARTLGLSRHQAAIWAGASIHEVAQVAVAASLLGGGAIAVAMTVKLGRVALLAPVYVVIARGDRQPAGGVPLVPWFVIGFAVAVAVRSTVPLPGGLLSLADGVTTLLLAAGMFGLGLGLRLRDLWPVPRAALVLATVSTVVAAGSSLVLVLLVT